MTPFPSERGGGAVALRSHSVHLVLGRFGFDIVSRPLAMAVLDGSGQLAEHVVAVVEQRPAIIEVAIAAEASGEAARAAVGVMVNQFDGPVVARTGSSQVAQAALRSGAVAVHDPSGLADPNMLTAIADSGASVIIGCAAAADDQVAFLRERVAWATASGIASDKIVVDGPADLVKSLHRLGAAVMIQTADEPQAQGIHVKAVIAGARIVAGRDLVATRRTIDTVGELLARRHAESGFFGELTQQE